MASAIRPMLLRQAALCAATRRAATVPASAILSQTSFQSSMAKNAARVAAFHASSRRSLLPPGPQVIKGTVNDAVPVPDPTPTHGSYHWTFERVIAAGLVPLTVAPFAAGSLNPALDAVLCALLLVHSHTGFQSIIIDYVPKRRYAGAHKASLWLLNAATVLAGIGLYEFETNDVGVTETVKRVWKA
ncbi:mitochondrial succinate dehydrogenase cytochrome b560 subunit D [Hypoxylon argillaceum]|nr:mitochondrial succinate dehydrogenase cytochrome b560 subunit D [Hypoxylon argillaceum]KAI1145712.1 mitochondrial succinate dehydrogenase cytochrome b560 subunit D [Nemania diffusa]